MIRCRNTQFRLGVTEMREKTAIHDYNRLVDFYQNASWERSTGNEVNRVF